MRARIPTVKISGMKFHNVATLYFGGYLPKIMTIFRARSA
jgi:hypothetical protein